MGWRGRAGATGETGRAVGSRAQLCPGPSPSRGPVGSGRVDNVGWGSPTSHFPSLPFPAACSGPPGGPRGSWMEPPAATFKVGRLTVCETLTRAQGRSRTRGGGGKEARGPCVVKKGRDSIKVIGG